MNYPAASCGELDPEAIKMAKGDDIQKRLIALAIVIIQVCSELSKGTDILNECNELCRIISASLRTVISKKKLLSIVNC